MFTNPVCLVSEQGAASTIIDGDERFGLIGVPDGLGTPVVRGFTLRWGWGSYGAGIYSREQDLVVADCVFYSNCATWVGGAIFGGAVILDCRFDLNYSSGHGGALALNWPSTVARCLFDGNSAVLDGGAINCATHPLDVSACEFRENHTGDNGGAIYCSSYGLCHLDSCLFDGNYAKWGGAIGCGGNPDLQIDRCVFHGNGATTYGCILAVAPDRQTRLSLTASTCYGNECSQGAIFGGDISPVTITSAIIANNQALGVIDLAGEGVTPALECCDVYGNQGGDWVGPIAGQCGVNGNFSACPSFCDAPEGNLGLCDESPCLPGNHPDGYECGLIGAFGQDCSCGPTGVEPATWGGIKALYR